MATRHRIRRMPIEAPGGSGDRAGPASAGPTWAVADRVAAADRLDLGMRVAFAAELQETAGNAAVAQLIGQVRVDQPKDPPLGQRAIMDVGGEGARGFTRARYIANPPIFRIGGVEHKDGAWAAKPVDVNLPELSLTAMWPTPGRHVLRPYGRGKQILEVSEGWSGRIREGEDRHVRDFELAWDMTWGRVASVINAMASGRPCTGATPDAARAAAWRTFKDRLPAGLRPEGDAPDAGAQEAKWGPDTPTTVFSQLMGESARARDDSGLHTPLQSMKEMEGANLIEELTDGKSDIPGVPSAELIGDAWKRATGG